MTKSAVVHTDLENAEAGADLARQIRDQLGSDDVHAVIVFASPSNDYPALLRALQDGCMPSALVGCSSAGEFTNEAAGTGMTCAVALHAPDMQFTAALGRGISDNCEASVKEIAGRLAGVKSSRFEHKAALVLADVLAGYIEELIDGLTAATGGAYRFFGGGAGDDDRFQHTHVFFGTEVHSNAAVVLEILSHKPLGISARHGWQPASPPLRVTETDNTRLLSLNVAPAAEVFADHAAATQQNFDRSNPVPFFLHNIVGIKTPTGHKLRVPLGVGDDGAVALAGEVPMGATTHIMSTGGTSAAHAAASAVRDAVRQVQGAGHTPAVALFFDCVATRLRLGNAFVNELDTVEQELEGTPFAGFNSYGQIVRSEGQFSGFHNCTAVVCVIPE